jgi:hypothetical protein
MASDDANSMMRRQLEYLRCVNNSLRHVNNGLKAERRHLIADLVANVLTESEVAVLLEVIEPMLRAREERA